MINIRQTIIDEALDWLDTPFHHHSNIKYVGVDCVHLCGQVALAAQLIPLSLYQSIPVYPIHWFANGQVAVLKEQLDRFGCIEKDKLSAMPGDIITFKQGVYESHVGILVSQDQFVHACPFTGKVVVNSLSGKFLRRWVGCYSFPGVK